MYYTPTELINRNIKVGAIESNSEALKKLIEDDRTSAYKVAMQDGHNYFLVENTNIMNTEMNKFSSYQNYGTEDKPSWGEVQKTNPQSANIKKPSETFRNSILQKIDYGLSNGVMIEHPDELTQENILEVLGKESDATISEHAQVGSVSALGYIHCYINKDGSFGYTVMNPKELIVIYSDDTRKLIESVIRYYTITSIQDGENESKLRIEVYSATDKKVYDEAENNVMVYNTDLYSAYGLIRETDTDIGVPVNWGKPPFIEYINNPERITDLQAAKLKIDDLDYQDSRLSNDFTDKPESLIVLKEYDGTSSYDAMDRFKVAGVAAVSGDGGIDSVKLEIPYEGKQSVMKETKKDIYSALQSVDTSAETVSKAPSGIALQMLYRPLEMKVQRMYQGLTKSLYDLMYFINKYFEMSSSLQGNTYKTFDVDDVTFTYTPNRVLNLVELADVAVKFASIGLPTEEWLKLLPFIDQNNIEDVVKQIEKEREDIFNEPIEDHPEIDE